MHLRRPRRPAILTTAAVAVVIAVAVLSIVIVRGGSGDVRYAAFAVDSPFRVPIAGGAAVDPNSAAMISRVTTGGALYASLVEFGIPIYDATTGTPRYAVPCRQTTWGPCPFDGLAIPVPDGARPHTGSDGAMVVLDRATHTSYEFWQAVHSTTGWSTQFSAVNDTNGSGWGGASTGSGASRLAGVVRLAEVAAGSIPHALALQSQNVCATTFRAPALKTDGRSTRPDCLPEGARLQLDPTLNLSTLKLTRGERMVATAMQRYGGYVVDVGGAPLSVSFELDPKAGGDSIGSTYQKAGFRWDYDDMADVPWKRLRVLR